MGLFLLDVGIKKESIYKMEIFDKEKKDVDIIRKELNLPTSKVFLYKDDDIFYGKDNVEYFTTYKLDNLIKELKKLNGSIVIINLSKIRDNGIFNERTNNETFRILEGISIVLNVKFIVYEIKKERRKFKI